MHVSAVRAFHWHAFGKKVAYNFYYNIIRRVAPKERKYGF
jgi:hypothetical protein